MGENSLEWSLFYERFKIWFFNMISTLFITVINGKDKIWINYIYLTYIVIYTYQDIPHVRGKNYKWALARPNFENPCHGRSQEANQTNKGHVSQTGLRRPTNRMLAADCHPVQLVDWPESFRRNAYKMDSHYK